MHRRDEQRHDRLAEELDDVGHKRAVQRGDLADQRVGEDQQDRNQQRGEGQERARQLFSRQQLGKVLGHQIFIALVLFVDAVEHLELLGRVLRAVDLIGDDQVGEFAAEVAEQRNGEDKQGNGNGNAAQDVDAQVDRQARFPGRC